MKRFIYSFLILAVLSLACMGTAFAKARVVPVYRVYNPETGEHLYTTNTLEVTTLVDNGWKDEKTAWVAPNRGDPVYRLYNPNDQHHLYTKDENEIKVLTAIEGGWQMDNNGGPLFFSDGDIPIYRLYTPITGDHHLTTDENEYKVLGKGGDWQQENIAFYALEAGSNESGYGIDPYANLPKHETVKMIVLNGKTELSTNTDKTDKTDESDSTDKNTNNNTNDNTDNNVEDSENSTDSDTTSDTTDNTDSTDETDNSTSSMFPNFDVYFTPTGQSTETYLGPIVNTELVGTDYSGVQIGGFEAGTYTLRYKVPGTNLVYTGSVVLNQYDFNNCEKIQQPTGALHIVYKEILLRLMPDLSSNTQK